MIREFQTDVEWTWRNGPDSIVTWHGKVSLDLKWVAGAKPFPVGSGKTTEDATSFVLGGSGDWRVIRIPYEKFMAMWEESRRP